MVKKTLWTGLVVASLLVGLAGCQREPMPTPDIGGGIPSMEVGQTLTVPLELAVETPTVTLRELEAGLTASYSDGSFTFTATKAGDYTIEADITAKGYQDCYLAFPVEVLPPVLEAGVTTDMAALETEVTAQPLKLELVKGQETTLVLSGPEGMVIGQPTANTPTITAVAATTSGANLTLTAREAGEATLRVELSHPDYRPITLTLDIHVALPPARLEQTEGFTPPLMVQAGQSAPLPYSHDGRLAATVSDPAVAKVESGKVVALKEGTATITITVQQEDYADSQAMLELQVTPPPPQPETGSTKPAATAQSNAAGTATQPDVREARFANLEQVILQAGNEERTIRGLGALTMNDTLCKAAALRAKETAEDASHTRPDGRRGLTVFEDFGIHQFNLRGENLAGKNDVEDGYQVVQRWMNSESHKAALLDARFTETGIGVYYDGEVYRYCQLFGGVVAAQ